MIALLCQIACWQGEMLLMEIPMQKNHCDRAIALGTGFVKKQLVAGQYGLSSLTPDHEPGFGHDKGHLFSGYFIADALGKDLNEVERALLLVRLLSEELQGLWGYCSRGYYKIDDNPYFVDADDTAFALRTFRKLEVYKSPECLRHFFRERRWLSRKGMESEKGFVTFADPHKKKPTLVFAAKSENNFDLHPEVNANVFNALIDTNYDAWIDLGLISRSQSPQGYWHSYFYPDKFYSTFQFLELLRHFPGLSQEKKTGVKFLQSSQNPDGSWGDRGNPYETALALKGLAFHVPINEQFLQGIEFIVNSQHADGSWPNDNVIWEFHQDNQTWQGKDTHRAVTTSLCVSVLKHYLIKTDL
ncbi:MAG: hypothetical protein ACRENG_06345 [bacterium]